MLDLLVKEEDTDDAGDGSCAGPATDPATPRTLEAQPASDPEAGHPATAATLPPPARLAWLRRRKTKSAKVESLLLQMLHQDAEESRETREAVERGWARLEAWARAEQESRARDAEREQQHRQEVLNCMRQTNALIRSFMGDTSLLLRRILEAPRMEDGGREGAAEGSVDGTGRTAAGSRLAGHRQAKRKAGSVDDDDAATSQSPAGSTTP
nr:uncharacterized protein LOC110072660 [Pogona vitticeps]